jgi:hypothetical protein
MVLRLVLVSIVAGLGVTPPAESEVAGWSCTVQTWLDARLAEWNVTQPSDEGTAVSPSLPAADLDVAALERALMAAFGELPGEGETAAVPGTVAGDRPGADAEFEAVVEEMVAEFALDESEPAATEVRLPAVPAVVTDAEAHAEEIEAEIVEAELDTGETSGTISAPAMATLPAGEDELCEVADGYELPPCIEMTREPAERTALAPRDEEAPAGCVTAAPTPGSPLRHAVRLTRDAVYAWINLLQSPALVTVPQ